MIKINLNRTIAQVNAAKLAANSPKWYTRIGQFFSNIHWPSFGKGTGAAGGGAAGGAAAAASPSILRGVATRVRDGFKDMFSKPPQTAGKLEFVIGALVMLGAAIGIYQLIKPDQEEEPANDPKWRQKLDQEAVMRAVEQSTHGSRGIS